MAVQGGGTILCLIIRYRINIGGQGDGGIGSKLGLQY